MQLSLACLQNYRRGHRGTDSSRKPHHRRHQLAHKSLMPFHQKLGGFDMRVAVPVAEPQRSGVHQGPAGSTLL